MATAADSDIATNTTLERETRCFRVGKRFSAISKRADRRVDAGIAELAKPARAPGRRANGNRARRRAVVAALAAAAAPTLAACGFEPLYDPAGPAAAVAGRVEVAVIEGTPGYLMRERLIERLGAAEAPSHRLAVALSVEQVGVALAEDDVTTRFDVIGVADWRLAAFGAERPALAGSERAVSGYSAPATATASAFAVLSARRDAEVRLALLLADRIARRVAVAAPDWSAAPAGPDPAPMPAPRR